VLGGRPGQYVLQASIAACHARALTPEQTDWHRIVSLYDELAQLMPSPVVELNRAVAVGMAFGTASRAGPCRRAYRGAGAARLSPAASVRGDLLMKLGRVDEAREDFERAASMTRNARSANYCWLGRDRHRQP